LKDFGLSLLVILLISLSIPKNLHSQVFKPISTTIAKKQFPQLSTFYGVFSADGSLFTSTNYEGTFTFNASPLPAILYSIDNENNYSIFSIDTIYNNANLSLDFIPIKFLKEADVRLKLNLVFEQLKRKSSQQLTDFNYVTENTYELHAVNKLMKDPVNRADYESDTLIKPLTKGQEIQKHLFIHPDFYSQETLNSSQEGGKDPIINYLLSGLITRIELDSLWFLSGNTYLNPLQITNTDAYQYSLISEFVFSENDSIYTFAFYPLEKVTQKFISGIFQFRINTSASLQVLIFQSDKNKSLTSVSEQSYSLTQTNHLLPAESKTQIVINSVDNKTIFYGLSEIHITDLHLNTGVSIPSDTIKEIKKVSSKNTNFEQATPETIINPSAFEIDKSYQQRENSNFIDLLGNGFIPFGFVDIDMSKFIGYNDFEGFKFGIGAQTNHKFSKRLGLAGSVGFGLWTKRLYYNYGFVYSWDKKLKMNWTVQRYADYVPSGSSGFELSGMTLFNTENFKNLYVNRMDFVKAIETSVNVLINPSLKTQVKYSHQLSEPGYDYVFTPDLSQINSYQRFKFNEVSLKCSYYLPIKTKHNQQVFRTLDQRDILEFLITFGTIPTFAKRLNYTKLEGHFKKYFLIGSGGILLTEITAAIVSHNVPYQKLFNLPGTWNRFGIYATNSFSTMKPNEFTADRFLSAAIVYNLRQPFLRKALIQPRLSLMNQLVYGTSSNIVAHQLIILNSPTKGFSEAGILIHDILKSDNLSIGTGFFYRYGKYHLENQSENFRFKLVLGLGENHNDNPSMR